MCRKRGPQRPPRVQLRPADGLREPDSRDVGECDGPRAQNRLVRWPSIPDGVCTRTTGASRPTHSLHWERRVCVAPPAPAAAAPSVVSFRDNRAERGLK